MQQGFLFHIDQCIGCKACAISCARYKGQSIDHSYRKTIDYELGECKRVSFSGQKDVTATNSCAYTLSVACNHCDHPVCVYACPTKALQKDADTGLVTLQKEKCARCHYCEKVCPYGAILFVQEKGYPEKCEGCKELVDQGIVPHCVQSCPTRALEFVDVQTCKDLFPRISIAPLPPSSQTLPNMFFDIGEHTSRDDLNEIIARER